jgi:hypothetical protein
MSARREFLRRELGARIRFDYGNLVAEANYGFGASPETTTQQDNSLHALVASSVTYICDCGHICRHPRAIWDHVGSAHADIQTELPLEGAA